MLGECPNFHGGTGGKSWKMDQKQGIPLQCAWGRGNSGPEFWQIPWYLFLDIQLQFCCVSKKYILKSKM